MIQPIAPELNRPGKRGRPLQLQNNGPRQIHETMHVTFRLQPQLQANSSHIFSMC